MSIARDDGGGRNEPAERFAIGGALVLAVVLVTAVVARSRDRAQPHIETQPPRADSGAPVFSGCAAVRFDGTCEIAAGATLRLWIEEAHRPLTVTLDGSPARESRATIAGGTQVALIVPAHARVVIASRDGAAVVRLALADPWTPPAPLAEARALRDQGKLDEASALLERMRDTRDPILRARVLGVAARVALSRGDEAATDEGFARALDADEGAGLASDLADDAAAWVFSLVQRERFAEAHRAIDRADAAARVYPDGRARGAFYRGVLAGALGHTRRALASLQEASLRAQRLGLGRVARFARQEAARSMVFRGRAAEGLDDLVALYDAEASGMTACDRADLAQNIAWISLHVPRAPHGAAWAWVDRALALYRDECPSHNAPQWTTALVGNRADAAIERGDLRAARAFMRETRAAFPHPPATSEVDWLVIDGRIADAERDTPRALRAFEAAATRAAAIDARDLQRIALEHRADVLARTGARAAAVAALDEAAALTDAQSAEIPIGEGRESYLRAREAVDARRIELLVALGEPAQALAHLRRARARVLSSLVRRDRLEALSPSASEPWEQAVGAYRRARNAIDREAGEDWRFAASTLADRLRARAERGAAARRALEAALAAAVGEPQPFDAPASTAEGEVLLAIYGGGATGIAFVAEGARVRAEVIGKIDPSAPPARLAELLLTPFADAIARARRIAVITFGDAHGIDVHALPFRGAPLIAHAPVIYPLDAPHAAPSNDAREALVVVDPHGDLAAARNDEARVVRAALAAARSVTFLQGDDARGDAVREALLRAGLFHYAGHGVSAGRDGWQSALPLAEHGELSVSDVLALARAPSIVVLGGCETARGEGEARAEGLGMAQAFVIAGANAVVAATRVIDDRAAADVSRAFYMHLAEDADVAGALRAAQRDLDARGVPDWAAFRVLSP